jgi:hypothetical protein
MVERSSQGDRDALEHIRWKIMTTKSTLNLASTANVSPIKTLRGRPQLAICRIIRGPAKTKYMPVQDNTKLEDGDANQLGHGIFVRQKQFLLTVVHVDVRVAGRGILCCLLGVWMSVIIMITGRGSRFRTVCCKSTHGGAVSVRIYSRSISTAYICTESHTP